MDEKLLAEILAQMVRIADSLDIIARAGAPQEPNYIKPIGEYVGFDWATIGATVVNSDNDGPTHLEWGGFIWTRRSPSNKFAPAIWYSRASGKDEEGNNNYLKLITFKTINDADPIPGKVAAAIPPAAAPKLPVGGLSQPVGDGADKKPYRNHENTTSAKPPSPTGQTPPSNGNGEPKAGEFVGTQTYYTLGSGRKWNLSREWLVEIATLAGINTRVAKPDFSKAFAWLPYFAEGKAGGKGLADLKAILQQCNMDVHQAISMMREQVRP